VAALGADGVLQLAGLWVPVGPQEWSRLAAASQHHFVCSLLHSCHYTAVVAVAALGAAGVLQLAGLWVPVGPQEWARLAAASQ